MSENGEMIYKADAIKAICKNCIINKFWPCAQKKCRETEIISDIPAARPDPGWHEFQVTQNKETGSWELEEPLPEEGQYILISVDYAGDKVVLVDIWHDDSGECWLESGYNIGVEAVAWMAPPEPYTREKGGFL